MFEKFFDQGDKYFIRGFVGEPGVGKSCVLQQIINQWHEQGINVWSTRPFANCYKISIDDLGIYDFCIDGVQGGVLILDELGVDMNNRNFKEVPKKLLEFFKLFRHFKLNIYVVSQGIDIDITVRRLINKWYKLVRKELNFIFFKIRTNYVDLIEVDNNLVINNGDWQLLYTPGDVIGTYNITKSFKYFNSFALPSDLQHYELERWFPNDPLEIGDAEASANTPSILERIRAKRGTGLSAREEPQSVNYDNLSREELLDLWKKGQI